MMNRRYFLEAAAAAVGSLAIPSVVSAGTLSRGSRLERIGVGLFTMPKALSDDFAGALSMIAETGYKEVEFFGPYPFSPAETKEGFKQMAGFLGVEQHAYYGHTLQQVRALLDHYGLSSPSMHADFPTLRTRLNEAAEAAHVLGQKYIVIPSLPKEVRTDLDAYKRLADEFNEFGRRAKELGLRFAYHNHGNETAEMEGEIPFQLLLERTDPDLVDYEMDICWTVAGGADPVAYFEAYPGRFRLVHIKDTAEPVRFKDPANAMDNGEVFSALQLVTDAGSGVLDLPAILDAAQRSGVEHFLVERDLAPEPAAALRNSYSYLSELNL